MKPWHPFAFMTLFIVVSLIATSGWLPGTSKKPKNLDVVTNTVRKDVPIKKIKNTSGIPTYIERKNSKKPRFLYDQYIYHLVAEDVDGEIIFVRMDKTYHNGSIKGALVWRYTPNIDTEKSRITLKNQRWDCNKKKQVFEKNSVINIDSLEQISDDDSVWYNKDEGYPEPNTINEMTMNYICNL